ncbi:MAG: RNA-binding protein [Bacteroidetes bacterium HGW-Bacteroidetes-4]|jgi:ribosome-associated protein|nr:MAG: RNA-binding protein [Bacteroidetes bacterium HGW-Bacteroidetes-4]
MTLTFELKPSVNEEPAFIELNKLLKVMQLVENGGMANTFISDGLVKLNGKTDLRKRAKVKSGDEVTIDETVIKVV